MDCKIDEEKGIVMFSFEASREEDYEMLDMLYYALDNKCESKAGYVNSKRMVAHFKGVIAPTPEAEA